MRETHGEKETEGERERQRERERRRWKKCHAIDLVCRGIEWKHRQEGLISTAIVFFAGHQD